MLIRYSVRFAVYPIQLLACSMHTPCALACYYDRLTGWERDLLMSSIFAAIRITLRLEVQKKSSLRRTERTTRKRGRGGRKRKAERLLYIRQETGRMTLKKGH